MAHTEKNEKKKDNKEVKRYKRNTPIGKILMSNALFFNTKREMQKEMTNQDTQGISKTCKNDFKKNEFKKKEVTKKGDQEEGDEDKEKVMEIEKTREG